MAAPSFRRNVVLLGVVSFLADVSGEMLVPVLPFLITAAGGAGAAVGLLGGLGEGVAHVVKVFAGRASDHARRRLPLVAAGYGLAALGKIGIAAATGLASLVALRAAERVGKGIRSAPRDAILAESAGAGKRGAAFGLHRAMDTSGAILGAGGALVLATALAWPPATIAWVAAALGGFALLPLVFVREPPRAPTPRMPLKLSFTTLPSPLKRFLVVAALFGLGNATLLLFLLRGADAFTGPGAIAGPIALFLLYNITNAAVSYPVGRASDRFGRVPVLVAGFTLFAAVALGFGFANGGLAFAGLFALLGVAHGAVDGTERAFVADLAPATGKGTALGAYHTVAGVAAVTGGAGAGWLLQNAGAAVAFSVLATAAFAAAVALVVTQR